MLTKERLFEMLVSEFDEQNIWETLGDKELSTGVLVYLNGYASALKAVSTQLETEAQQRV